MNTTVQLELTEQDVEQLLRLMQQGFEQARGSLSQADQAAYYRIIGKLHLARAEGLAARAPQKRAYTRRTAKKTTASKTPGKRGRPAKKTTSAAKTPTTTEA